MNDLTLCVVLRYLVSHQRKTVNNACLQVPDFDSLKAHNAVLQISFLRTPCLSFRKRAETPLEYYNGPQNVFLRIQTPNSGSLFHAKGHKRTQGYRLPRSSGA